MSTRNGIGLMAVGILLGGLVGAVVALLFAPQSGAETRVMIKDKSIELRDKAQQTAEQARVRSDQIIRQVKEQGQNALASVRRDGVKQEEAEPAG